MQLLLSGKRWKTDVTYLIVTAEVTGLAALMSAFEYSVRDMATQGGLSQCHQNCPPVQSALSESSCQLLAPVTCYCQPCEGNVTSDNLSSNSQPGNCNQ